jgi:dUTP pyrophosphatase
MLKMYVEDEDLRPTRATEGDAGLDLKANGSYIVAAGKTVKVHTGVCMDMGDYSGSYGSFGMIVPRSSMAKIGLVLANTLGIIDSGYRGELMLMIKNTSDTSYSIGHTEKVGQLLLLDCSTETPVFVASESDLSKTERGEGGFGSSGKH